jgi:hypothetical protein
MLEPRNSTRIARRRGAAGISLLAGAFALIACERTPSLVPPAIADSASLTSHSLVAADSALHFPDVPDPARTPGAVLDVTAADICVSGYSKRVRNVPAEVKRQAYASYGVRSHLPGEYEIDHLISLSLGGSNSIRNLWPESFRTHPWNAFVKDALEVELHRRVCEGTIDLAKAQYVISHNWVIGYRTYVNPIPPAANAPLNKRGRPQRGHSTPRSQFDSRVP